MRREKDPPPDVVRTQPSADERCDRSHVERAHWLVTSPQGHVLTLCRYHYRLNEVALAVLGWGAQEIERIEA